MRFVYYSLIHCCVHIFSESPTDGFKVVVIGDARVGKSCLLQRFMVSSKHYIIIKLIINCILCLIFSYTMNYLFRMIRMMIIIHLQLG